ncbi:MAG: peptide ABC transporter substrate-binding protein [Planctomycetes bacterium]|nr:peptide ABC transporter substrate-binding protein [Planctomycetota bacterium]
MRPVVALCALLAGLAALSLAWSVKPPPPGGLTVAFGEDPPTLDPARAKVVLEGRILSALLEGLTVPDPVTLEPRPGAAESWDISADGLTYTFHLRASTWSDGHAVTAEDFRWSWLRVLSMAEAPNWELFAPIRGARDFRAKKTSAEAVGLAAPDARTLVVTLERPTPYFLTLTTLMTYLPVPRPAVEAHGRHWTRPGNFTGNGPFVLSAWDPSSRIVALKNPRFHDAARVSLPAITFLSVAPGPAQFNLYEGGLARWIADPPPDLVRDLKGRPDLHVSPRLAISFLREAANHAPFNDNRVRRAFALAVDSERIVKINGAGQLPWTGYVPPGLAGYRGPDRPARDVRKARELLAQAGFPGGRGFPKVRLLYPAQDEMKVVAETLFASWAEDLGVTVVLDRVDRKEWLRRRRQVDYELCVSSWIPDYLDPNSFLEIFASDSGNNQTGWTDPLYDALLRRAAGEQGATRLETLAKAEERLLAEGPMAPLYVPVTIELWDSRVRGVSENSLGLHPLAGVEWAK